MTKKNCEPTHAEKPCIKICQNDQFNYPYGEHPTVSITVMAESMTDQQFLEESDINLIMDRYLETGELSHVNHNQPLYIDCPAGDYLQAVEVVEAAATAFDEMPAAIRDRFQNEPSELLSFLEDQNNYDEGVQLGLINPPNQSKNNQTESKPDQGIPVSESADQKPKPE